MQLDMHDDKVYQDHLSSQAATALSYSYLIYRDLMDCNPVLELYTKAVVTLQWCTYYMERLNVLRTLALEDSSKAE